MRFCLEVFLYIMNIFSKIRPFYVKFVIFAVLVISALSAVVSSYAEPERYDFPKSLFQPLMFVEANLCTEEMEALRKAYRTNEIKRESIAAFLRRHNRWLTDEQVNNYAVLIKEACERFGQDPFVITALVIAESTGRSNVVSRGGDYGLMQVRWRVHQSWIRNRYPHITEARDILNPKYNLLIGTEIFTIYRARANQDIRATLVRYSGGSNRLADRVIRLAAQLESSHQERLNSAI